MNEHDEATTEAARLILEARLLDHKAEANEATTLTVYVAATPTPPDALPAVRIVENTLAMGIQAKALYHRREVKRFEAALAQLDEERS